MNRYLENINGAELEKLFPDSAMETEAETVSTKEGETPPIEEGETDGLPGGIGIYIGVAAALAVIAAGGLGYALWSRRKKNKTEDVQRNGTETGMEEDSACAGQAFGNWHAGTLHNIGKRQGQQDSLGTIQTAGGLFAVVADGMGGLADGDRVSQNIVMTMLNDAAALAAEGNEKRLFELTAHANREVNRMLGSENRYKSGSTLVAVLAENGRFHWVSVGDSRICLYRGGSLLRLNTEHTYEVDLLLQAVNGELSFDEAARHPQRKGLTSFLGMGELKHVDGSRTGVPVEPGDRIVLMSDGVFNTLSEREICRILRDNPDVGKAAMRMEEEVLRHNNPKQDNFTAVILAAGKHAECEEETG